MFLPFVHLFIYKELIFLNSFMFLFQIFSNFIVYRICSSIGRMLKILNFSQKLKVDQNMSHYVSLPLYIADWAGAVEYTDCASADG